MTGMPEKELFEALRSIERKPIPQATRKEKIVFAIVFAVVAALCVLAVMA